MLLFVLALPGKADENLPLEARNLVNQFTAWEQSRARDFQKEITEKRNEVIQSLEALLKEATTEGDLDGAIAIRRRVEAYERLTLAPPDPGKSLEFRPGMTLMWCPDRFKSVLFSLEEDGKVEVLDQKVWENSEVTWASSRPGKLEIAFDGRAVDLALKGNMLEGLDRKHRSKVRVVIVGVP